MNQKTILYQLLFETTKFIIASSIYIFSPASSNMLKIASTSWVVLLAYTIFLFVTFFRNICRPLTVRVEMHNYVTEESVTKFFAHSEKSEFERTVHVGVYVERYRSIFYKIGALLALGKTFSVAFNTVPEDYFTLVPENNHLIQKNKCGFEINLTDIIQQSLRANEPTVERSFTFTIVENRDADINNWCKVDILPNYLISGKNISLLYQFIYDMKMGDKHRIEFFKNYTGLQLPI